MIGVTDEKIETVREFMKNTPMDYSVAIDAGNRMSDHIGINGIPHVVIVTPDNVVRWQGFPTSAEDPLSEETITQILAAYKSDNPVKAKKADVAPAVEAKPAKRGLGRFF